MEDASQLAAGLFTCRPDKASPRRRYLVSVAPLLHK